MYTHSKLCHSLPYKVRVASGGRIVIPAEVRQELGVKEGEELLLTRDAAGFRITTYQEAIRRAQELFARIKPECGSIVDELASERREESIMEEREFSERYRTK